MVWDLPIACYLFLAGLGAGAYVSAIVAARCGEKSPEMARAGRIIAPVTVAIGLVLLMVDAEAGFHNPLRFFYLVSNLSSVMAWGVIILAVFMVVSIATLLLDLLKKRIPLALEEVGAVFSLGTAAYTGVLLGVVKTFPLWNTPLLPVLFVVSAASTGIASVVLAGCAIKNARVHAQTLLAKTRLVLPCIEIVLVALLLLTTQGVQAGIDTVVGIVAGSWAPLFWIGLVAVGLVLPLVVSFVEMRASRAGGTAAVEGRHSSVAMCACAEAGVIVGGFILRYLVVMAALPIS
ncbi:polysulfide reductase [Slackia equolifaciens]|uniref:Polysulfide reductase n=1 Tax=Slackia equolifaciens TaxID=498718 RepID=A0A3N0B4P3_9ACTN|nr:NrfD/PsrC family molybdoenzyme membrane anchor subunit [Slackia equolifaciens]RNL41938.1 polysulfide reductase [Slackia equolifaciens]